MDITAKKMPADENGVRIAELDEMSYRKELWTHKPLTDFWMLGSGIAKKLDDGTISTLNDKLNYAVSLSDEQPEISVTYFKPDSKKNGGEYVTHTGVIKRVDEYERKLIFTDKTVIPIDDIYGIDGEIYSSLY